MGVISKQNSFGKNEHHVLFFFLFSNWNQRHQSSKFFFLSSVWFHVPLEGSGLCRSFDQISDQRFFIFKEQIVKLESTESKEKHKERMFLFCHAAGVSQTIAKFEVLRLPPVCSWEDIQRG